MTSGKHVMLNGRLLPAEAAVVSPLSEGFMYGAGVFETLRVSSGKPEFWIEHCERLQHGTRALGLAYRVEPEALLRRCAELVRAEGAADVALKIVVFRDIAGAGELISLRPIPYSADQYKSGFRLKVVRGRPQPEGLAGLKTLNHLAATTALRAARAEGFDEVVFVDAESRILEAATANIFIVKNGRIFTPPVSLGVLPGVIRRRLLADAALGVSEKILSRDELCDADEVFVTNSLMGVMPVRGAAERTFNSFGVARDCGAALKTFK